MEFKLDPQFTEDAKATFMSLLIHDLDRDIDKEAQKTAEAICVYTQDKDLGMVAIVKDNFLAYVEYVMTEMLFLRDIKLEKGLKIETDIADELVKRYETAQDDEELIKTFMPNDFKYEESRWLTTEEINKRNEAIRPYMQKLWDEIKKDW